MYYASKSREHLPRLVDSFKNLKNTKTQKYNGDECLAASPLSGGPGVAPQSKFGGCAGERSPISTRLKNSTLCMRNQRLIQCN